MEVDHNDEKIASIIEACHCLGSDKITERRKSAENVSRLLSNSNYVAIIDDNSDNSTGFTWNDVFKAACSYMKKVLLIQDTCCYYLHFNTLLKNNSYWQEVEKFKADESKGVGLTQNQKKLRENQLGVSSTFVMNSINLGSCRKPRLDIDLVLDHFMKNMTDSFNRDMFGCDLLNSLNNEILSRRSYWSKLKPNSWISLFLISVKVILKKIHTIAVY